MNSGSLIVLNGGSSAGKTSIGEALQDLFDEPYLLLGIDAFYRALPLRQKDHSRVDPQYYSVETMVEGGLEYFRLAPGPILDRITFGRYRAIARLLELGLNVIADEVLWKREWLFDAARVFEPYRAFLAGVFVSDEEAERRHAARGRQGMGMGWYRGSSRYAHADAIYDLTIDTTNDTSLACAEKIKTALANGLEPTAFARVRGSFSGEGQ
ncbi:MAG TPA: hypothetical protein VJX23_09835 [Candidatus Binataceae bacterium]|nr:hypothetical protein [Candidatus Binataceae bacterium]